MTQDQVIQMLHKVVAENQNFTTWTVSTPHLVALVHHAIAEEREACAKVVDDATALYTHPPQRTWVGLTDEEQSFIYDQVKQIVNSKPFWVRFADAIEAKLKEKNT